MKKYCIKCKKRVYNHHKEKTRCRECWLKDFSKMMKGRISKMIIE